MRVIAHQTGFFGGGRRRPGEEFEVPEGTEGSWFSPVDPPAASKPAPEQPAAPTPQRVAPRRAVLGAKGDDLA